MLRFKKKEPEQKEPLSAELLAVIQQLGELEAVITTTKESKNAGHPEYKLTVTDKKTLQSYEVADRFNAFRKVKAVVEKESKGLMVAVFPKTFAKSSVGVKLSKSELAARETGLNAYIAEMLTKLEQMNEKEVRLIADFMGLKHLNVASKTAGRAAKKIEQAFIAKRSSQQGGATKSEEVKVEGVEQPAMAHGRGCCTIS
ncbi:hypothetical protein TrVE_jg11211 [Triparma verrucosa]|uniref:PX domain-containing protein n=1 Tax=Triparma verrucosa TaxID=1606542 RepID=A0A9W7F5C4_9STRA|nr:hypothetical protein TrVE_jg11211 [Triparma verrucosa]